MSRQPHAIVIAFHFPPSRSSAVYRTRAWAHALVRAGWRVTVISARREWFVHATGGADDRLAETVDPSVDVRRVRFGYQRYAADVANMSWLQANFPFKHDEVYERIAARVFPERHAMWRPAATLAAARAGLRRRPQLVLGTGNPYAGYAAARAVARFFRVPYVLDFHDAWTLNQFTGEPSYDADHPAWAWERRVIDDAAMLVTVNDPLRDWYVQQYPESAPRFRVAENGWAPDVLRGVRPLTERRPGPVRFGYVGTLRTDLPLDEFFAGWRKARRRKPMARATMDLYGYLDYFAANRHRLIDRIPVGRNGVEHHGPVSQLELPTVYSDLDVLVNLLPSSPYVSSGKVYDYMASGRAIVAVHDADTHAAKAGAGFPMWFQAAQVSADAVADALVAAAERVASVTDDDVAAAAAVAATRTWDATLAPVVAQFGSLS